MNSKGVRTVVWVSVGALALIGLMLAVTGAWTGPATASGQPGDPSLVQGPNSQPGNLAAATTPVTVAFAVGTNPTGVAFDPNRMNMWVTNMGDSTASVLRIDGTHEMTPSVGSWPTSIAFDGANMWVVNRQSPGYVHVVRASDGAPVRTIGVGDVPGGIAFDGTNMWVTNNASNNVSVLRASDGAHVITASVGVGPFGIAFDGTNMWVTNASANSVSVLRLDAGPKITHVMTPSVGSWPTGIAFDGANMWVTNTNGDTVSVLRASDGQLLTPTPLPVGDTPSSIAFDGVNMWVVNEGDDTVTLLRTGTFAFEGQVAVGNNPRGIASDGKSMWVASTDDNLVTRVSGMTEYRAYLPAILRNYVPPTLIFADDFNTGALTGWTPGSGTWTNPGSTMQGVYASDTAWSMKSASGSNVIYEGKVNLLSGSAVGLVFRSSANGASSYAAILDTVQGFKISRYSPHTILVSYPMTVQTNHWYTIRVVASGSTLEAYLDGVKRLTATDTTYTGGQLGVMLHQATATYDDLQAWETH